MVLLTRMQYNKYKKHIIESKIPDGTSTTVYRCGPMVDLCVGPHIPHTGKIKAFMVTKVHFLVVLYSSILIFLSHFIELRFLFPRRCEQRLSSTYLWNLLPRQEATNGVQEVLGGGC